MSPQGVPVFRNESHEKPGSIFWGRRGWTVCRGNLAEVTGSSTRKPRIILQFRGWKELPYWEKSWLVYHLRRVQGARYQVACVGAGGEALKFGNIPFGKGDVFLQGSDRERRG